MPCSIRWPTPKTMSKPDAQRRGTMHLGDVLIAVAASGRTPYTIAAAASCPRHGLLPSLRLSTMRTRHWPTQPIMSVLLKSGPEVISGSTRLGAGTAQKAALNLLSTLVHTKLGAVHDGLMVNVQAGNQKLVARAARIIDRSLRVSRKDRCGSSCPDTRGDVKLAVLLCAGANDLAAAQKHSVCIGRKPEAGLVESFKPRCSLNKSNRRKGRTMIKTTLKTLLLAAVASIAMAGAASAGKLTIESWRNDDAAIWKEKMIPAFNAKYPDIQVEFTPTAPKEYNAALNARLEGGTAGDIITCRPFDASLELFNKGHLAALNDLPSMANFSDVAKSAWTTDDGKSHLLRAHGIGDPWLHLQQGHLQGSRR